MIAEIAILVIMFFGVFTYLACLWSTQRKLEEANRLKSDGDFLPPVTILKPLKGLDAQIYENLLSFIQQDYPQFQVIFGLQSPHDSTLDIVRLIAREKPDCDIRIVISDLNIGYNPKVNNLAAMIPEAKYEYMVISDSDVRVRPDYLRRNISHLSDPSVGLVTNLIRGSGRGSVAAIIEAIHLNSFVTGMMSFADVMVKKQIVVGKSIFFRRPEMESIGGIEMFRNYLAEDYLMGQVYRDDGFDVVLSGYTVDTLTDLRSFKGFASRHIRWARLRWKMSWRAYLSELLINFCAWSVILAGARLFDGWSLLAIGAAWAIRIIGEMLLNRALERPLPFFAVLLAPVKELIIFALWPMPLFNSKINWRNNRLKVGKKSLLSPVS